MQPKRSALVVIPLTLLFTSTAAANSRLLCETPGTVQLVIQSAPNAIDAVGELRSLVLPGGQPPLGLRDVIPLECSRATAAMGSSWKLIWYCYETENSDPAYIARVFTQDNTVQAVVARQQSGEAERALYKLNCVSGD